MLYAPTQATQFVCKTVIPPMRFVGHILSQRSDHSPGFKQNTLWRIPEFRRKTLIFREQKPIVEIFADQEFLHKFSIWILKGKAFQI